MEAKKEDIKGLKNARYSDEVNREVERIIDLAVDYVYFDKPPETRAITRQFFKSGARDNINELYSLVQDKIPSKMILATIIMSIEVGIE